MDKAMKTIILIGFLAVIAASAHAMPVHRFPGIDQLIKQAQHIAVITFIEHIRGDGQGYDEYHVLVRRTLKGTVPEDKMTTMSLFYLPCTTTNLMMDGWFVDHRTYVVFLEDTQPLDSKAPYRNLQTDGSCWEVTLPHPDWRPDPKTSIRDTIKMLVETNIQAKVQAIKGDQSIFNEVFRKGNAEQK